MGPLAPWPQTGTETVVDHYELRVGGAAGNTGLALAALTDSAGEAFDIIGTVGDDSMGRWLEQQLSGVMTLTRVPASTALTVGLNHPDGQRTFVSHLGHLEQLPLQHIEQALEGARSGDILLLCGYFLLPQLRELAPALLSEAQRRGVVTTLDTGWPTGGWTPEVRAEVMALMASVDVFLPNREELVGVAGLDDKGHYCESTTTQALTQLKDSGCLRTVVKLGPDGALYFGPEGTHRCSAPKVKVVDTVGAGDTFNAALLTAVQRGADWRQALEPAVGAASLAIASSPRRYPRWDELLAGSGLNPSSVTR